MPGPPEAALRLPGRGPRARIAEGLCPGRLPCGGAERRRGGPDPAPRPRRASFPAARWAPLSQSRARPAAQNRVAELCARFGVGVDGGPGCPAWARAPLRLVLRALREPLWIVKARSVLGTRPGFMLALGSSSAYAGFLPHLPSSQAAVSRLNLTHQRP